MDYKWLPQQAAETEEAEVTAETVAEEMAENLTDEVPETEIITVKMAERRWSKDRAHPFLILPSEAMQI